MKYLKKNKNILVLLSIILAMGIICGIIMGKYQTAEFKENIIYNLTNLKEILLNNNINNILFNIIILISLSILSIIIIFYLLDICYLFYIGLSIGFNIYILTIAKGINGFIFSICYNLIFKLPFLLLLIFILIKLFHISKQFVGLIIYKNDNLKYYIIKNYIAVFIGFFLIVIIDVLYYLFGNNILQIITNML